MNKNPNNYNGLALKDPGITTNLKLQILPNIQIKLQCQSPNDAVHPTARGQPQAESDEASISKGVAESQAARRDKRSSLHIGHLCP